MCRLHRPPLRRVARRFLTFPVAVTVAAPGPGAVDVPPPHAASRAAALEARPAVSSAEPDTTDASGARTIPLGNRTLTIPTPEDPDRPLMILNARLEERIRDMAHRSPKWARALEALRRERFTVLVGSITEVEAVLPELVRYRFDGAGAAWIFTDHADRPAAAAVTLNLPMLAIRNRITGGDARQLRRMVELHLAHEIYGHLVPVVRSGTVDHPCSDDPDPASPAAVQLQACVMERESEILTDLGYEPRDSYRWDFWSERIEGLESPESPGGRGEPDR